MSWLDLSRFQLAEPSALWALLLLPLLLLFRERQAAGLAPWRSFGAMVGRGLALLCVIVAMAQPFEESRRPDRSVAVVLDASASVGPSRRDAAKQWVQGLEKARDEVPAVWVVAGREPTLHPSAEAALAALDEGRPADAGTALRGGLELALAHLPPARSKDVVLLSDGAVHQGEPEDALKVAEVRDVAVHTVALDARTLVVAVETLSAEQDRMVGDPVTVTWALRSNGEAAAAVELREGGTLGRSEPALVDGVTSGTFSFTPETSGLHDLTLVVAPEGGAAVEAPLRVRVRPRPAALLVGASGAARALRKAVAGYRPALDVTEVATLPEGDLADWTLVALLDPDLPGLGADRIAAVRRYVQGGGRLLVTGGENGLVTDEDVVKPLAEVLPVRFAKRKKKQRAPLSVVYCLDSSDSMAGGAKFELAAAALAQSLYLLPETAKAGVIGFADFPTWVSPLATLDDSDRVVEALANVQVRGGTSIYHALQSAYEALRDDEALVKHVVLLSDGQSTTTFARSGDVVTAMARRDITVSTIAVTKDSDRPEMERIAKAGNGRAHYTESFAELPRLFLDEMMQVTRTNKVDESIVVHAVEGSPLLERVPKGLEWPTLDGFVRGEQKAGSELALATGDGRPLLVQGRVGRGQVTMFTSDVGGAWSSQWAEWRGLEPLWEGVVDAILRPEPPERITLETSVEGRKARVWFSARDDLRNPRNDLLVEARVDAGEREVVELVPVGPGRYGAELTLPAAGAALVQVAAVGVTDAGLGAPPPGGELVASLFATPPLELRAARSNRGWLERAAEVTGGLTNPSPAELMARPTTERVEQIPRWPPLLVAALVLLVLDLGWRRVRRPGAGR